ncbi:MULTISPECIES: hypothetical protein [Mycolicibacterium]|uniref:Transmembrane protein n=1 Tax=Mycolicibacterium fortuitum subsp. fortuitum DSM 46621 = ATCC 6841 = JCM 6387 TaxID=1214102 RepID=K0V608_MYCFO|nr:MULTISPECIES: hypothetical protein [Mycolicibacterium]AIY46069.1 hypothetical protein G155_11340 [Mycobacterium sp. VKM Ac-1817D]CRL81602.1 hypothetical protein CPGR_04816 [Mycolicibacter nonchromogenicus]AMD54581.1 hypothetical protein ATO49_10875 [Mycolicibacterium fortuitum subsp. fortuitum DSM 46621 = ATCC 6841 = JCM 6387]EJZ14687.1 hypothetical protein MFORT_08566 [Mycolicibacterium fortuitum subsp. fortuitum DSM 46621 = ATCC 6841 = JCM 6387]MBP3081830.1 hypothetical protein [Mycolicib
MYTATPIPAVPTGPSSGGSTPHLWSAAATIAGLIGMALALFSLVPAATVVAGIGVAAGTVALLRTAAAHPLPAVAGTVISALAVAVSVVMLVAPALATPTTKSDSAGPSADLGGEEFMNENLEDVLANELQVDFGEVSITPWGSPRLSLTLTNKTDRTRSFYVTLGAFDSSGAQIATDDGAGALLGPHAIQKRIAFESVYDKSTAEKIKSATFKVVKVTRTL